MSGDVSVFLNSFELSDVFIREDLALANCRFDFGPFDATERSIKAEGGMNHPRAAWLPVLASCQKEVQRGLESRTTQN